MKRSPERQFGPRQRGMTTLVIAIVLLIILSIVAMFATSVGLFEQRTATNENRAKLTQTAAESAVNLGIEFIKANTAVLTSERAGGWLHDDSLRWVPCTDDDALCATVPDATRRAGMYRYSAGDSTDIDLAAVLPDGDTSMTALNLGNATTDMTITVSALLCRMDGANPDSADCVLEPEEPGRTAVTVVADAAVDSEGAAAQARSTIATFRQIGGAAAVPLVASGTVMGLGNAEIVANPNAGGPGVPASIWSPCPVDIEAGTTGAADPFNLCPAAGSSGIGSVITCHLGEYLQGRPREDLLTICPFQNNACGCPGLDEGSLSGKTGNTRREGIDILDRDGNTGLPDVQYFPREPYDNANDPLDDSLFEVIFAQDVVPEGEVNVAATCAGNDPGGTATTDCAKVALAELGAVATTCSALNENSTGLFWIPLGRCDGFPSQIGSPDAPAVIVIEAEETTLQMTGNSVLFGMLYVRSSTNKATFAPRGSVKIYGMAIVEGFADPKGGFTLVYSEEVANAINNSPAFTQFAPVPGSWLDSTTAF